MKTDLGLEDQKRWKRAYGPKQAPRQKPRRNAFFRLGQ